MNITITLSDAFVYTVASLGVCIFAYAFIVRRKSYNEFMKERKRRQDEFGRSGN